MRDDMGQAIDQWAAALGRDELESLAVAVWLNVHREQSAADCYQEISDLLAAFGAPDDEEEEEE